MGTINKMKNLLILLVFMKVANLSSAGNLRRPGVSIFDNQFWKEIVKSMKELEKTLGQHQHRDNFEESEEITEDTDNTEMLESWASPGFMVFNNKEFPRAWWRGNHVCESKEISQLPDSEFSGFFGNFESHTQVCTESNNRYTCKNTVHNNKKNIQTIVNYDCCEGYRLERRRCTKFELHNLTETARKAAPEFSDMLEATGILEQLEKDEHTNYTLFVTADNTLDDLRENFQNINQLEVARRRRQLQSGDNSEVLKTILMNHVVRKTMKINDLSNNQILDTLSGGKLRYNIYPQPSGTIRTVNCKTIVKADQSALKGVVHVVDGVLKPQKYDIAQVLMSDSRFTRFMKLMNEAGLIDILKTGNITVFAPTDEALARGFGDFGGCNGVTPKHHIVEDVLCSSALDSGEGIKVVTTMSGKQLSFTHPADSSITIDDHAHITQSDIIASNGVIHVLDENLLPDAGKNISQMLKDLNLTTFESLLMSSELSQELDVTWLVPKESVFEKNREKIDEIRSNPEQLNSFILAHALKFNIPLKSLKNGQQLLSRNNSELNFNFYSVAPSIMGEKQRATVNCAPIRMVEDESCRAYIYQIADILYPPEASLMDIINDEQNGFSILKNVIKRAGIENELIEKMDDGITFLAPTDSAFDSLDAEITNQILTNSSLARQVLMGHILPGVTCCHAIMGRSWLGSNFVETKGETQILVHKDPYGRIHFGSTEASKCDLVARNGVIHAVNSVIMPEERRHNFFSTMDGVLAKAAKNPNMEVLLFGL